MSKKPSIKSSPFQPGLALIFITILVVAGFQVYWLRFNFKREESALIEKTNFGFRETVMRLQAESFDIRHLVDDSVKNFNLDISEAGKDGLKIKMISPESVSEFVTAIENKVGDSLKKVNSTITISSDEKNVSFNRDSAKLISFVSNRRKTGDGFLRFLFSVDSLRDSIKLSTIDSAFTQFLIKEKISVPFTVKKSKADSAAMGRMETHPDPFQPGSPTRIRAMGLINKVTTGFANPVTYELKLGNTFPYLLKKISLPILFSVFLIGLTIISLVFLYRNLQRQRRLTEIKNDFISNVTHELKTPIATVGVAIEALRSFNALNDPQRTKEYLDISQNELNRLSMLVDKVLKLSMFENHELELKKEYFNLKGVVEEVVNSFQLQFEKRQATCEINTKGTDFNLFADKLHLTSVIYNLVDNALKYSPGQPQIIIHLEEGLPGLILSVSDNGIGIPSEYISKVFDKFFRVPAGDTHNVKGYGLGLSYVSQVVAKHNGTVLVESIPGKGSTFIIKLPRTNG